ELAYKLVSSLPRMRETLIVGIARGDAELIPDGSTEIWPGDRLLVLVPEEKAAEVREALLSSGDGQ
ncbi:MAG: TrkA C-terminal domain-containing protein, partial [Spirochaetes bacterium]|nr:TrkA C-terminal domain-containing protein [Spirochaetota bacterium]